MVAISLSLIRRSVAVILLGCCVCAYLLGVLCVDASANSKYASVVIDADTKMILSQDRAKKRLYPASLTKMMTLYMVFEKMKSNELSFDTKVRISRHAASMPSSKLGLRAGSRVLLRYLVHAAAVRSANDAAVALAEAIAGTEWQFGRLMTEKAKEIGMKNTRFRNATGLTMSGHYSTAYDMAILSMRLWEDFPEYYSIFSRKTLRWNKKTYRNTNSLLRSYRGADGIKTGYTRASGYNLAVSAEQNSFRIIAVVFGGRTSRTRDMHMKKLLDRGFRIAKTGSSLGKYLDIFRAPGRFYRDIKMKSDIWKNLTVGGMDNADTVGTSVIRNIDSSVEDDTGKISTAENTKDSLHEALRKELDISALNLSDDWIAGLWGIQLGAFNSREKAMTQIRNAIQLPLSGIQTAYHMLDEVKVMDNKVAYRARFTGFNELEAKDICRDLTSIHMMECVLIPPSGW